MLCCPTQAGKAVISGRSTCPRNLQRYPPRRRTRSPPQWRNQRGKSGSAPRSRPPPVRTLPQQRAAGTLPSLQPAPRSPHRPRSARRRKCRRSPRRQGARPSQSPVLRLLPPGRRRRRRRQHWWPHRSRSWRAAHSRRSKRGSSRTWAPVPPLRKLLRPPLQLERPQSRYSPEAQGWTQKPLWEAASRCRRPHRFPARQSSRPLQSLH